jgi:RNA polymerase sigma-70 factor (ECF subfamily)
LDEEPGKKLKMAYETGKGYNPVHAENATTWNGVMEEDGKIALIAKAKAGEREEAFEKLLAGERGRAIAVAYHLTGGDREAAKDVAQEAFLKAYRALPGFRGEASMRTWLMRIVVNQASKHRRKESLLWRLGLSSRSRQEEDAAAPAAPGASPERLSEGIALRSRIATAMDGLSKRQRNVFALVHLEGMTVQETAEILGKSPGTVKSHLHRALVALRRDLADMEPGKEEG